jgi:hypothetical protein
MPICWSFLELERESFARQSNFDRSKPEGYVSSVMLAVIKHR